MEESECGKMIGNFRKETMPVLIQSKVPPRQSKTKYPGEGCKFDVKLDVTSGQLKDHPDRLAFSPMTKFNRPGGYQGFHCFENFWQSGKRYKELSHLVREKKLADIERWKSYDKPYRRHPNLKGKGWKPVDAIYPDIGINEGLKYIESRKLVYVPYYHDDILMDWAKDRLDYWKEKVQIGKTILVVDYDGPKLEPNEDDGEEVVYTRPCEEVTVELLKEKINDPRFQFGHGYVVAAALLGITPDQYVEKSEDAEAKPEAAAKSKKVKVQPTPKLGPHIKIKAKLRPVPLVDKCTCCGDSVGGGGGEVISVKMDSLRNKYGKSKYANQMEWEQDSDNHVYIGRGNSVRIKMDTEEGMKYVPWPKIGSPFANPFPAKKHGRDESIRLYKDYIKEKLGDPEIYEQFKKLKGKTLGCWCKPNACHGDALLELLEEL